MKTQLTKGLAILGIGAMMIGALAVSPALADGRHDDSCGRPAVQVRFNVRRGHDFRRDNDRDRRDNDRDRDRR